MAQLTTVEDKYTAARQKLQEVEASVLLALASARSLITALQDENHELRRQEIERRTEFYTEAEFAELLKVSESTIARIRKRNEIEPLMVGGQFRYSSSHVEQAHEIFGPNRRVRARRSTKLRQVS